MIRRRTRRRTARTTRSGAVQAPEALLLDPPRLLVLGEPGSGKTTLLKYLAVRIASRDPAFGEFARKRVPNTWARWLDGMHRRLAALNLQLPGFLLLLAGLLAWLVGLFFSPHPIVGLLGLVTLFFTCFFISVRLWVAVCSSISVALLVFFGVTHWMPGWSVGAVALPLVLLLEAYWIRPFLRALRWWRDRSTNYPLPLYLTLNDQTGSDEPLDRRLARPLEDAGFADARAFLRRRLEAGECLLLMDGLDEVVDGAARDRIAEWLGHTRIHARNPLLVTCRIAAFEAHPLEHRFSGFRRMEVQEFTDRQVELFIRNWFADRRRRNSSNELPACLRRWAAMPECVFWPPTPCCSR